MKDVIIRKNKYTGEMVEMVWKKCSFCLQKGLYRKETMDCKRCCKGFGCLETIQIRPKI